MLIVFDLDDTLIETTFQISPHKLKFLIESLKDQGVCFQQKDLDLLFRINQGAVGSEEALLEFLELHSFESEKIKQIFKLFRSQHILPESSFFMPNLHKVIDLLSKEHQLSLVTRGQVSYQSMKIDEKEFPKEKFKEIIIVEQGSKIKAYKEIQKKSYFSPFDVVVVGDRIHADLVPAKRLGFQTIHVKTGRKEAHMIEKEMIVDYQICSLNELSAIIQDIQIKNFLRLL